MIKRKCFIFQSSKNFRRHICIDVDSADDIITYIEQNETHRKKFKYIIERILTQNFLYFDLYNKEDINKQCSNVSAMKFFKTGENTRIYCKELSTDEGEMFIIAAKLLPKKKTQRNNKEINELIKIVSSYEYEIEK